MDTIPALKEILASTYSLASQTHLAHWNVTGPRFPSLHALFGSQYADLYEAADDIAEYIRSLNNAVFVPGGLGPMGKLSKIVEMPISGLKEDLYLKSLLAGHNVLIKLCKEAGDQAGKAGDTDTQNFLNERSTAHKKMRWMLTSTIGA